MYRYTVDDFVEGVYRNVATSGTHYELVFRERQNNRSLQHQFHRVKLLRPYAPLTVVSNEKYDARQLVSCFYIDYKY